MAKKSKAPAAVIPKGTARMRDAIVNRLEQLGKSKHWLSQTQTAVHPGTAQQFLYTGRETSARLIAEMLDILDLRIVPAEDVIEKKETASA